MLTPLEEVRSTILATCSPLPVVALPLVEAVGCVAAAPVVARFDVPPFANTAMDGYALRAADTDPAPARLEVIGVLPAGAAPDREVGPGEALRIMTGAPIPPGADAVVMVERTRTSEDGREVLIEVVVTAGQSVRDAGSDLLAGQEVVARGTPLTAGHVGVLASLGEERVQVHRRPVVGVLTTGDELVDGPGPLRPGLIHDSNRPLLLVLAGQAGGHAVDLGRAPDDPDAIAAALQQAIGRCDAVLVTGGVSVGDFDFVGAVLARLGTAWTWDVAMKPGKPLAFGVLGGRPVFGLPGNPVSAAVSFEMFARPALRTLLGRTDPLRPRVAAVADEAFGRRPDGKVHILRVLATPGPDARLHVRSAGGQGSHVLGALAAANALAFVPDGDGVQQGDTVEVILLDPA